MRTPKKPASPLSLSPRFWWNREHTRPWTTSGHRKNCFSFNVLFNYSLTARGVQMDPCRTQLLDDGHIEVHGGELYKSAATTEKSSFLNITAPTPSSLSRRVLTLDTYMMQSDDQVRVWADPRAEWKREEMCFGLLAGSCCAPLSQIVPHRLVSLGVKSQYT